MAHGAAPSIRIIDAALAQHCHMGFIERPEIFSSRKNGGGVRVLKGFSLAELCGIFLFSHLFHIFCRIEGEAELSCVFT